MVKTLKFKATFFIIFSILFITSCQDESVESKYSKGQFVGKWQEYKKRTVTKNKSTNATIDDKTAFPSNPYTVELKDNGLSVVENDPGSVCEWTLKNDQLNTGCSDFYTINQYTPNEFVLTYALTDSKNIITNYMYYRKVK